IQKLVIGQVQPKQPARHVLHIRPGQVAVTVVNLEVAAYAADAGTDVLDHGVRHIQTAAAEEAQPEAEIDILAVAEKILVEEAGIDHVAPAIQGSRSARREDL